MAKSEIGQSSQSKLVDTKNKEISVILDIVNNAAMNIFSNYGFLHVYSKELDCWVIWCFYS